MTDIYFEIGALVIVSMLGAYAARLAKQPMIPAYIVSGVLLGSVWGIVTNQTMISTLSEIGIAFLLFIVGLELNFNHIKDIGKVSFAVGSLQVVLVGAVTFGLMHLVGFGIKESVYMGLVATFSSTMIVIKILTDSHQLNTLHGRLAVGVLIMQDILAIIALSLIESSRFSTLGGVSIFFAKGLLLLSAGILASKLVFPEVFKFAAKSSELLLSVSLGLCFIFSLLFRSIGFSVAIGAFVAGILLANLPYNIEIIGRVKGLRDFFVIIFFTSLGLQLKLGWSGSMMWPMIMLTLAVVALKPLIIFLLYALFGYTERTAFLCSFNLGQVSEFSLLILGIGMTNGAISEEIFFAATIVGIFTMTLTSYSAKYEDMILEIYKHVSKLLPVTQHPKNNHKLSYEVVLCGHDRIGYSILRTIQKQKGNILVIDHNPDVVSNLSERGISCMYGNFGNPDFLDMLDLSETKLIISTAPMYHDNAALLAKVSSINRSVPVVVTANQINEALWHYKNGASYVILPHILGGDAVATILQNHDVNPQYLRQVRNGHIKELFERHKFYQNENVVTNPSIINHGL
jgi:Kef-type K+ transport system membrane component KefB